ARAFEVLLHALGIDNEPVDEVGGFGQQVIHENGRVREDDALHRRVGDVALVPERDVLKSRLRVTADDARQAADLLRSNRVFLVRHGGGAFLLFAEVFLRLADFGALKMANFDGDFVERAADDGERSDVSRVAVALDYLGSDGRGLEAETSADAVFMLGLEMAEGADSAGELAHAH